jgi:plastocyanin
MTMATVLVAAACGTGGEDGSSAGGSGGEERKVLVDYRHDEFTSAFLRYYPEVVKVRPGDTVRFEQTWTGEPHSVTMGKVVDNIFEFSALFEQFDSEEEARAGGVDEAKIAEVNDTFSRLPGMVGGRGDNEVYQPGAQPCYIEEFDVPQFSEPGDEGEHIEGVECPTKGEAQPAFTGRQGFYNSGFIPAEGKGANTFTLPVATDATPGTYKYFCNYHWISMGGTVEVVDADADIPSQQEVSRQARKEIERDAKAALAKVREAKKAKNGKVDGLSLPLAGREADEDFTVIINEFLPANVTAKAGEKVTWTFDGSAHTVSFNVPKYFPIFTVAKDGTVTWNPKSYEPVGFDVPPPEKEEEGPPPEGGEGGPPEEPEGRDIDAGTWNGSGGFHSSGSLNPSDRFSVTFTKPGTYSYACVLHPQMVGTLVVKA